MILVKIRFKKLSKKFIDKNEGYALLSTVMISAVMLAIGGAIMTIATHETREAVRWKNSNEAYFLARGGVAESVYRLKTDYAHMSSNGYEGQDTQNVPLVSGEYERNFSFSMAPVDPDDVHFMGSKYMTGAFQVTSSGKRGNIGDNSYKRRGIEARIERDTFLRYSRFVQQGDLSYGANAKILADLYVGGNLNLNAWPVEFWGDLEVGGSINNQPNGIFHGDITGTGVGIDLAASVDIDYYRDLSQGLIPGEGTGQYLATARTIDLSLYDFSNPSAPKYNGAPLPADFNGIVFCEDDISVKGVLEGSYIGPNGVPQTGLTFVSNDDIVALSNVRTGNTLSSVHGLAPLTFNQPSGSKQTQTLSIDGIVDTDTNVIRFKVSGSKWQRMQMTVLKNGNPMTRADGGVVRTQLVRTSLASENNQTAVINGNDLGDLTFDPANNYSARIDYYSSGTGDTSVQVDACNGEPVNVGLVAKDQFFVHSNTPKQMVVDAAILARDRNWQALGGSSDHPNGYDTGVWELTINGPIITKLGGDAGPWTDYGTRYYRYDMDMIENAPPAFPVPSDWWVMAYWKHLKEGEIEQ